MSLSLFDLVGPVMMGPSSSQTAGAVRIGYMARLILGKEAEHITLCFHPVLIQTYAGHRTYVRQHECGRNGSRNLKNGIKNLNIAKFRAG